MKWLFGIIVVVSIAAIAIGALPAPNLQTPAGYAALRVIKSYHMLQMREVTANDTALTALTKDWTHVVAKPFYGPIEPTWSHIQLSFYAYGDGSGGGDPNNSTAAFKLFAAKQYGPAKLVYQGTLTVGGQCLSCDPTNGGIAATGVGAAFDGVDPNYKFVDRISPSGAGDQWPARCILSGASGSEVGDVAVLDVATLGYCYYWCEIGSLGSMTALRVLITGNGT
jgi:hypothetical protein